MVAKQNKWQSHYDACSYNPESNSSCMKVCKSYGKCCGPCDIPCYIIRSTNYHSIGVEVRTT